MTRFLFSLCIVLVISSCSTNDYRPEYQKEKIYDGAIGELDSIVSYTYNIKNRCDSIGKDKLVAKVVREFDENGYLKFKVSSRFTESGLFRDTEIINRDKHSLIIDRRIIMEAEGFATSVVISKLTQRSEGVEKWQTRYYYSPDEFVEKRTEIEYTEDSRITKDSSTEEKPTLIEEKFDSKGLLISKLSLENPSNIHSTYLYYSNGSSPDSTIITRFSSKDSLDNPLSIIRNKYPSVFDKKQNVSLIQTVINDTLRLVTENEYSMR